ncbi:ion transporter [Enterovibrio norvegicus FF-33]|uniref:ion transporter n=1 Tax=Enterovibrio norvegicus TaxID=188144 RepID=UPI0002E9D13B|nr:ion transporter [Enterovibrio norvegicus]OEE67409.1 ion transporter [Enterovibrio norvegicus FF-33]
MRTLDELDNALPETVSPFQIGVLILSVFVVLSLMVEVLFPLSDETREILLYVDTLICGVFFIDFVQQFRAAKSKLAYMKWGWLDLISCIPLMDINQFARILRVVRLIRAIKSISMLTHTISENKASSSLHFLIASSLIMMVFGSIYVLYLERGIPGANIQTAADAFWWTFITITTVGYGDFYPVTFEGRIVAIMLITMGVGMFGSFTAVFASWLIVEPKGTEPGDLETKLSAKAEKEAMALHSEVQSLREEIRELKVLLKEKHQ